MKHETRCIHTFEINYRRCKACNGQNKECRCYEPEGKDEKELCREILRNGELSA